MRKGRRDSRRRAAEHTDATNVFEEVEHLFAEAIGFFETAFHFLRPSGSKGGRRGGETVKVI
jgi:hypothetical protein